MKSTFLLSLLVILLTACGNDGVSSDGTVPADQLKSTATFAASPDQDTAKYVPLYIHKIPAESEIKNDVTALGGFGQVLTPPMEHPVAQMLTKGFWVTEGYNDRRASRPQKIAATGQWIQCFPNGTFFGGHWTEHTHSGAWYLDTKGKNPRLTLDSNVDQLDAVWDMQGIAGDGSAMAWVRMNDGVFGARRSSLSVKLMLLSDRPTKEQLAGIHGGL